MAPRPVIDLWGASTCKTDLTQFPLRNILLEG
jgi:hypothetical protein